MQRADTGGLIITGQDVAQMRRRVGLSQAELARRLGYARKSGRAYISNMERGQCAVPRARYPHLLEVLLAAKQERDLLMSQLLRMHSA